MIEVEELLRICRREQESLVERQFHLPVAALGGLMRPGMVNKDVPHHSCRDGEKVCAILPGGGIAGHPKVGLMYEIGCLKRVIRPLLAQVTCSEPPQLTVNKGKQSRFRIGLPFANCREQHGDVATKVHTGNPRIIAV